MRRAIAAMIMAGTCLVSTSLHSQTGSSRVTVPSPTVASLGRYGDIPVSFYTGVPDISIPLFTVKGRTLELPITLRYHASGIRVEDIASWVGLGWSLDAGGVITRTVRGKVDEKFNGYYNTGSAWYDNNNWPSPNTYTILQSIHDGSVDGDPDQFFFSFAGRSGQFVMGPIDQAGTIEVRTIPAQKLRIIPTILSTGIQSFEVTTEDGTKYTFSSAEQHWDYTFGNVNNNGEQYASSWYLTQIRAVSGDAITLSYTPYAARHRLGWYHELFSEQYGTPNCPPNSFDYITEYQIDPAMRLASITSAQHTVQFVVDPTLRADALNPNSNAPQESRLDHITVLTPTGTVLKTFQFSHDYFPGNRLRLLSVAEKDPSGASLPPYAFTYDGQTLPPRDSYAQDHWGYYNGKTSNTSYIPTLTHTACLSTCISTAYPGADRSPDANFMKAGVLTRITYPTGGYNEFVYEGNDYGRSAFGGAVYDEFSRSANTFSAPYEGLHSTTFTVVGNPNTTVAVHVTISMFVHTGFSDCANGDPLYPCPWGEMVNNGKWYPSGVEGNSPQYVGMTAYNKSVDLALPPGTYTLQTSAAGKNVDISIVAEWKELVLVTKKPAGGLRIAELRTADAMGNISITKYQYTLQSDPNTSSGVVGLEPRYDFEYSGPCHFYSRSSTSKYPLGAGSIGAVVYREVNVVHGANGEFGNTRHGYRTIAEWLDGMNPSVWPFAQRTSYEWERGQQAFAADYDAQGRPQRQTNTYYTIDALGPVAPRRFRAMSIYTYWNGGLVGFYGNAYEVVAGWIYQSGDTVTRYDTTGTNSFKTGATYIYANPSHLQLTEVDETNSDGTQRVTRMKYPGDYVIGTPSGPEAAALAAMQNVSPSGAHMPGVVIERSVSVKSGASDRVVQAEITTFKEFATGQFLPYKRYVLNSPSPLP